MAGHGDIPAVNDDRGMLPGAARGDAGHVLRHPRRRVGALRPDRRRGLSRLAVHADDARARSRRPRCRSTSTTTSGRVRSWPSGWQRRRGRPVVVVTTSGTAVVAAPRRGRRGRPRRRAPHPLHRRPPARAARRGGAPDRRPDPPVRPVACASSPTPASPMHRRRRRGGRSRPGPGPRRRPSGPGPSSSTCRSASRWSARRTRSRPPGATGAVAHAAPFDAGGAGARPGAHVRPAAS